MPDEIQTIPLPDFTPAPTTKTAPLNGGAKAAPPVPSPAAKPAPAPAPAPAPVKPQNVAVNPTIDLSGKPVTPFGTKPDGSAEIRFDDLERSAKPAPKKEEAKKDDAPPAEPAAPEPAAPENPFAVPDKPADPAAPGRRTEYAELSAEDLAIAKKLPNKLYHEFIGRLKRFDADLAAKDAELVEAKKAAESSAGRLIYEDPNSFRLDPEYARLESDYQAASYETEFYTEQLAKISAGEAYQYIESWKDGKPVLRDVPASPDGRVDFRAQAQVQRIINGLAQRGQQIEQSALDLKRQYSTAAQEVSAHYDEAERRFFPNMSPEKLPAEEKNVYDTVMQTLPRFERGRKSARMQALAAVVVYRTNKLLLAERTERERLQRLLDNTKAAAPIVPRQAAPVAGDPAGTIRFADLEA